MTKWLILTLVSLLLLGAKVSNASDDKLQITVVDRVLLSADRGIITLGFGLQNATDQTLSLYESLALPQGWSLITAPAPYLLSTGTTKTRLLHVVIPPSAQAKKYSLTYRVFDQSTGNILGNESVSVFVKAIPGLKLKRVTPALSLLAGESYIVDYILSNTGNTSEYYKIDVDDPDGFLQEISPSKFSLSPGASQTISLKGNIPLGIDAEKQHRLTLRVRSSDKTHKEEIQIPLISRETNGVGTHHKLYGELSMGLSAQSNKGVNGSEDSTEMIIGYNARGSLDNAGNHKIALQIRKGHDFDAPFEMSPEHYHLAYNIHDLEVSAGHQLFSGSQLSGHALAGIGGKITYSLPKEKEIPLKLEAFYGQSKQDAQENRTVSGSRIKYRFEKQAIEVVAGILHSEDETESTTLPSIEASWANDSANITAEAVSDGHQEAFQIVANAQQRDISASVNYIKGDVGFKGNHADTEQWLAGINWQWDENTQAIFNYRHKKNNLNHDTTKPINEHEEHRARLSRRLGKQKKTTVSIGYSQKYAVDQRDNPSMNEVVKTANVSLQHSLDTINFAALWEEGQQTDRLDNSDFDLSRQSASINWKVNEDLQFDGSYNRSVGQKNQLNQMVSFNAKYRLSAHQKITGQWQHSQSDASNSQSNALSLSYRHKLPKQRRIDLQFNHTETEADDETSTNDTSVRLEYIMPLDIPFRPRQDIATFCGKTLLDGQPMSDVILQLNEHYAVSDQQGQFCYRNILARDYTLQINNSRINNQATSGYIFDGHGQQIKIQLTAGESRLLPLKLAKAGQVNGRLVLRSDVKKDQGMGGVTVNLFLMSDLSNLTPPLQSTTDAQGFFNFNGLPAGRWRAFLNGKTPLPKHHRLNQKNIEIDLSKGSKEHIIFEVVPKTQGIEKVGPSRGFSVSG